MNGTNATNRHVRSNDRYGGKRTGERLYLSINQGCTSLVKSEGIPGARDELLRRAEAMWSRIKDHTERLSRNTIDLNVKQSVWRGKLYEVGNVAGVEYETDNLPAEDEL